MSRKVHNDEPGYIAERMNPHVAGKKVVIYIAADQGIDTGGLKYAVACDAHGTIVGDTSVKRARVAMKHPENFCDECREIVEREPPVTVTLPAVTIEVEREVAEQHFAEALRRGMFMGQNRVQDYFQGVAVQAIGDAARALVAEANTDGREGSITVKYTQWGRTLNTFMYCGKV